MSGKEVISCDECQKELVAAFDDEGGEQDGALISAHLEGCPDCKAFRTQMVSIRQEFVAVAVPSLAPTVGQKLMREAEADCLRSKTARSERSTRGEPRGRKLRRLAWAGGLAGVLILTLSWLISLNLAREVADLRRQLQGAERDLAVLRQQKELEEAQRQLAEAQEKQEKAIAALHFRMQELEEEVHPFLPTGLVSLPEEAHHLFGRREGL